MDVRRFVALLGGIGVVSMPADLETEDDTTARPQGPPTASPQELRQFLGGAFSVGGG